MVKAEVRGLVRGLVGDLVRAWSGPGPWPRGQQEPRSRTLPCVATVVVDVMLKPEIHDPQGEAIASACHRLGFGQVVSVRQGKRFEIELDGDGPADEATAREVAKLAAELLANPVIEEFSVRPGISS
jgi:phosphoribosylformylglycinamidine synthase PurS subunit